MIVVPFISSHFDCFELQEEQQIYSFSIKQIEENESYTGIIDGEVMGFSTLLNLNGKKIACIYLSKKASNHMISITKAIKRFFKENEIKEIYMTVSNSFNNAKRWANLLGFERVPYSLNINTNSWVYKYDRD